MRTDHPALVEASRILGIGMAKVVLGENANMEVFDQRWRQKERLERNGSRV
jgi:hypothetical protein